MDAKRAVLKRGGFASLLTTPALRATPP